LSLPSLKTRETPRFSEEDVEEMVERVKQNFPAAHVGIDPAKPGSFRTVLVVGGRSIGRRLLAAHAIAQYLAANPETLVLNAPVPMVGEPVQDDFREKARQFLEKLPGSRLKRRLRSASGVLPPCEPLRLRFRTLNRVS
jgi:hypothetical protein